MNKMMISAATIAAALFATVAAATPITAAQIASGSANGITFTATGGNLGLKTIQGVTGVGVSTGASGNEIDINPGQTITASSTGFILNSLTLAFLYDGPEFGDFQEVAKIVATLAGGGSSTATLTNDYSNPSDTFVTLLVDGLASPGLVTNATQATNAIASEITLGAVFGNDVLTKLEFTALPGICGTGAGTCNNQSDYSIESLDTRSVPEPSALGLVAFALALIGFGVRRRHMGA